MGKYARNGLRLAKGASWDLPGFVQVAKNGEFRHMILKYAYIARLKANRGQFLEEKVR